MGLVLWLPLLGDINNKGLLADMEISIAGTVTYEEGKIGKCARIGTGTQVANGIRVESNLVEELGDKYSCSVWIKPTGNHVHYEGAIISSGNWNGKRWAFGINQDNTKVDVFGPNYQRNINCTIQVNEWTHLVSTYADGTGTLYKNGEFVGTYNFGSAVLESDADFTCIGRETYASGYFGFNGCISDIRVYNHCLTADEVRELSQALTIHLPLSSHPNPNILLDSDKDTTGGSTFFATYTYLMNTDLTNGEKVTVQLKKVDSNAVQYTLTNGTPNGQLHEQLTQLTSSDYNSNTKTYTKTIDWVVGDNEHLWIVCNSTNVPSAIERIKIEKGERATPWCPNVADDKYSTLGYDNVSSEFDASGYGYDATMSNITFADAPYNNGSFVFNGTNSYVKVNSNEWMITAAPELTINFWAYSDDWTTETDGGRMFSCTETGGFNIEGGSSGYLRFPIDVYTNEGKTSRAYKYSNTGIKLADLTPGWHMFTFIYSCIDGCSKIYVDSNNVSVFEFVSYGARFNKNARLFLGCEANSANPYTPYFNGKMSDFRLYYTALDENAINRLYLNWG